MAETKKKRQSRKKKTKDRDLLALRRECKVPTDLATINRTELAHLAALLGWNYTPGMPMEELQRLILSDEPRRQKPKAEENPFDRFRDGLMGLIEANWEHLSPSMPEDCVPNMTCYGHSDGMVAHCVNQNLRHLEHLEPAVAETQPEEIEQDGNE